MAALVADPLAPPFWLTFTFTSLTLNVAFVHSLGAPDASYSLFIFLMLYKTAPFP